MAGKDNQEVREVGRSFWEEHHSSRDIQFISDRIFQTRGIGAGYDAQFRSGDPFQLRNLHMAYFVRGSIDNTVNLLPVHFDAGQLMVATPGSILTQDGRSDDFDMQVLQLSPEYVSELFRGNTPPLFSHRMSNFSLNPCESDILTYLSLTTALWNLLHAQAHVQAAIDACCSALLQFVRELLISQLEIRKLDSAHNLLIFNRFIALVNEHCETHRDMSFYADAIGLSKQHLSTVVTTASGRTASSWIDEALISRIKILLRHSDLTSAEIADRLNFPAPSHFARFFKRLTGMTPQAYRH